MLRFISTAFLISSSGLFAIYDVTSSIQKTADTLLSRLNSIAYKGSVPSGEVNSIRDEITALKAGEPNSFLVKSSKVFEKIRTLERKSIGLNDANIMQRRMESYEERDITKKTKNIVEFVLRKTNSNSRVAVFAFGKSGYEGGGNTVENYDLANFYTTLLASFESKNRMILAGNDLLDICRENSLDLGAINPKNVDAISRFLKKTKLDLGLFGIIEKNTVVTYLVYPNGEFDSFDDSYRNNFGFRYFKQDGLNRGKIDFWFEIEFEGRWKRIDLIEDRNEKRSEGILYLPLPDNASSEKSKIRLMVKNRGATINGLVKRSGYGRLIGANMTVDGIDLFLKDGKGLPSLPGQGRKLLISPPGHSIEDINGRGFAVPTNGGDESLLKIEGFLDANLNNERPFFIGSDSDSFATQFLGTNLKPLGFITLNFEFQELQGDYFTSAFGAPRIGTLPPRPVEIKLLKVDFYKNLDVSYLITYKTRTEINNLIPQRDQKIFRNE